MNCSECDACYIGNTKQYLHKRIYEHKYSIQTNKKSTALAKHAIEQLHSIDFENTEIIKKERNQLKRNVFEMIAIQKEEKRTVNSRADIENFGRIYHNIIHRNDRDHVT
ncbi:hypothetical protein WA026_012387 [Henosepilachna vigintioctopunctata]